MKSGKKVLKIGFGAGQCIVKLAQSVGDLGKIYGIDLSEGMYQVAKSKTTKAGLSEKVELICSDAAEMIMFGLPVDILLARNKV